jgi:Zn-dependent protease with chaperone function
MALGSTGPVEAKVTAATVAAAVSSLAVWALQTYAFRGEVPFPVAAAVQVIVPAVATFAVAFYTRHPSRDDEIGLEGVDRRP